MVTETIQSSNIQDYHIALSKLKKGDFVYIQHYLNSNPYSHETSSSLIKYDSHEAPVGDTFHFVYHGQEVSQNGIELKVNKDKTFLLPSGLVWGRIFAKCKMVIGPNEEVKQAFIDKYNAALAKEKEKLDQQATKELKKLEDALK